VGNRVAKVPTNGEKPQTGGATAVVDLDAFRANRAAATPRTG
jgi:hypothetical protein